MFHAIRPVVLRIDVLGDFTSLIFVFLVLIWPFLDQRIVEQVHLLCLSTWSALHFWHSFRLLFLHDTLTLNVVDTICVANDLSLEEPLVTIARIYLYRVFPDLIPCFLKLTLGDRGSHLHISDSVVADAPTLFDYHFLIPWRAQFRWIQISSHVLFAHIKVIIWVDWRIWGSAVRAEVGCGIHWHAVILTCRLRAAAFALTWCCEAVDIGRAGLLSGSRHTLLLIRKKHSSRIAPVNYLGYALMWTHAGHVRYTIFITVDNLRCWS